MAEEELDPYAWVERLFLAVEKWREASFGTSVATVWKVRARPEYFVASAAAREAFTEAVYIPFYDQFEPALERLAARALATDGDALARYTRVLDAAVGRLLHHVLPLLLSWHGTEIARASGIYTRNNAAVGILGHACAKVLEIIACVRDQADSLLGEDAKRIAHLLADKSEAGQLFWRYCKINTGRDLIEHYSLIVDALNILEWLYRHGDRKDAIIRTPGRHNVHPSPMFEVMDAYVKTDPPILDNVLKLINVVKVNLDPAAELPDDLLAFEHDDSPDESVKTMMNVSKLRAIKTAAERLLYELAKGSPRVRGILIVRGVMEALLGSEGDIERSNYKLTLQTLAAICSEPEGGIYFRANPNLLEAILDWPVCDSWLALVKVCFRLDDEITEDSQRQTRLNAVRNLSEKYGVRIMTKMIDYVTSGLSEQQLSCEDHQAVFDIAGAIWTSAPAVVAHVCADEESEEQTLLERIVGLAYKNAIYGDLIMWCCLFSGGADNHLGVQLLQPSLARQESNHLNLAEKCLLSPLEASDDDVRISLQILASALIHGSSCFSEIRAALTSAMVCDGGRKTWLDCLVQCASVLVDQVSTTSNLPTTGAPLKHLQMLEQAVCVLLIWSSVMRHIPSIEHGVDGRRRTPVTLWENCHFEKRLLMEGEGVALLIKLAKFVETAHRSSSLLVLSSGLVVAATLGRAMQLIEAADVYRIDEIFQIISESEIGVMEVGVGQVVRDIGTEAFGECVSQLRHISRFDKMPSLKENRPSMVCQLKAMNDHLENWMTKMTGSTSTFPLLPGNSSSFMLELSVTESHSLMSLVVIMFHWRMIAFKNATRVFVLSQKTSHAKQPVSHETESVCTATQALLQSMVEQMKEMQGRLNQQQNLIQQLVTKIGSQVLVVNDTLVPPASEAIQSVCVGLEREKLVQIIGFLSERLEAAEDQLRSARPTRPSPLECAQSATREFAPPSKEEQFNFAQSGSLRSLGTPPSHNKATADPCQFSQMGSHIRTHGGVTAEPAAVALPAVQEGRSGVSQGSVVFTKSHDKSLDAPDDDAPLHPLVRRPSTDSQPMLPRPDNELVLPSLDSLSPTADFSLPNMDMDMPLPPLPAAVFELPAADQAGEPPSLMDSLPPFEPAREPFPFSDASPFEPVPFSMACPPPDGRAGVPSEGAAQPMEPPRQLDAQMITPTVELRQPSTEMPMNPPTMEPLWRIEAPVMEPSAIKPQREEMPPLPPAELPPLSPVELPSPLPAAELPPLPPAELPAPFEASPLAEARPLSPPPVVSPPPDEASRRLELPQVPREDSSSDAPSPFEPLPPFQPPAEFQPMESQPPFEPLPPFELPPLGSFGAGAPAPATAATSIETPLLFEAPPRFAFEPVLEQRTSPMFAFSSVESEAVPSGGDRFAGGLQIPGAAPGGGVSNPSSEKLALEPPPALAPPPPMAPPSALATAPGPPPAPLGSVDLPPLGAFAPWDSMPSDAAPPVLDELRLAELPELFENLSPMAGGSPMALVELKESPDTLNIPWSPDVLGG